MVGCVSVIVEVKMSGMEWSGWLAKKLWVGSVSSEREGGSFLKVV
jgi:hypothetical protein